MARPILNCLSSPPFYLPLGLCRSLRPQGAYDRSGLPHFTLGYRLEFLFQLLAIILSAIGFEDAPSLLPGGYFFVELLEHRPGRIPKTLDPVQSAPLGRGRAVRIHPVHAVLSN